MSALYAASNAVFASPCALSALSTSATAASYAGISAIALSKRPASASANICVRSLSRAAASAAIAGAAFSAAASALNRFTTFASAARKGLDPASHLTFALTSSIAAARIAGTFFFASFHSRASASAFMLLSASWKAKPSARIVAFSVIEAKNELVERVPGRLADRQVRPQLVVEDLAVGDVGEQRLRFRGERRHERERSAPVALGHLVVDGLVGSEEVLDQAARHRRLGGRQVPPASTSARIFAYAASNGACAAAAWRTLAAAVRSAGKAASAFGQSGLATASSTAFFAVS